MDYLDGTTLIEAAEFLRRSISHRSVFMPFGGCPNRGSTYVTFRLVVRVPSSFGVSRVFNGVTSAQCVGNVGPYRFYSNYRGLLPP